MKDFYGRNFIVTSDTLVPRPETEQLIDLVKSLAGLPILPGVNPTPRVLPKSPIILDVGTGSGCIAVTIKKEFPEAEVYASDISTAALQVAQKNATKHMAPITFIISHLLEKVKSGGLPTPVLIVANLPYVDKTWPWVDQVALSSEPEVALYAEDHGLALIKELIDQTAELDVPHLILEADPCEHAEIQDYASPRGYKLVRTMGFASYYTRQG